MATRITQDQFLERMKNIHPQYDFSQFKYLGNAVKSTVLCSRHGAFEAHPNSLSNGQGCRACGVERSAKSRTITFPEFVEKARSVHGDAYDYTHLSEDWVQATKKAKIYCNTHGEFFEQRPDLHLRGRGCPKCGRLRIGVALLDSQDEFVAKCLNVHGKTYDLSKVTYSGSMNPVEVICRIHGSFFPRAGNFINRQSGCPSCANAAVGLMSRKPEHSYLARGVKAHAGKYAYGKVIYENGKSYITVICKEHGKFRQLADDHLKGIGCQKCATPVHDQLSFVAEATKVHGGKYSYEKAVYVNATEKVTITCPNHGEFNQGPSYHVNSGQGCPACARTLTSKGQTEVSDILKEHVSVIDNFRLPSGKHIDVYVPSLKIGVEYHGLIWHSEKFSSGPTRDYIKHNEALAAGIRLLHIYSDEWAYRSHVVTAMLHSLIGVTGKRVFARQCSIELVDDSDATNFYEDTHIQGAVNSPCYNLGLRFEGSLVAVMSFSRVTSIRGSKASAEVRELRRFSTNCTVVGGASRLLRAFLRSFQDVKEVISYSDNRLFTGGMYEKLGFTLTSVSEPSYCYVNPSVKWREEKYKFTRARMVKRTGFTFDPGMSERDNCMANNWHRLYDCGKTKWTLVR